LLRDSYGSAEGLPQNTVRSLTRTADGYLWAATQAGISRFDGFRFRTFQVRNAPGLLQDNIHVVAAGRDGSLWVDGFKRQQELENTVASRTAEMLAAKLDAEDANRAKSLFVRISVTKFAHP